MKRHTLGQLLALILILTSACSPSDLPAAATLAPQPQPQALASPSPGVPLLTATLPVILKTPDSSPLPPQPSAPINGLQFPIRAAFYYPWFPEAWKQQGMNPFTHYHPDLGFYNQDDLSVLRQQITAMQYGRIQAGIVSWWGQGTRTAGRFPALLKLGEELGFKWAVYIESEGAGNPAVEKIRSDLQFIRDNYAASPAYLSVNGRFVVFVYSDPSDGCDMASRWTQANTVGAYVVLKDFGGYRKCAAQPDGWHQYAPANAKSTALNDSYTISPGFWKGTESAARLQRDLNRWSADIKLMVASPARFQLITTFNEWGEGTAVESASEWDSPSHYGSYLDALHDDGTSPNG